MRKTSKKPNPKPKAVTLKARSEMFPTKKAAQQAFKQGELTGSQMSIVDRIKDLRGSGRTKRRRK